MQNRLTAIIIFMSVLTCLNACSHNLGTTSSKDDTSGDSFISQMFIDRLDFERDLNKSCQHTSECTAPLACFDAHCIVPPAITGKHDENTPQVAFETDSGKHTIWLEIVDDEYTMSRGLMMRRVCLDNWGMLFVYPSSGKRAFWMHNTYIPLDMVFIRADGSVSNVIENAEPLNDIPRYMSTDRVKYVLELSAGSVARFHLKSGSQFDWSTLKMK